MSNLVTVDKINQFFILENQYSGKLLNIDSFVQYLPRMISFLTNLVGKDLVIKGMDVTYNINDNSLDIDISTGLIIQDQTLIEFLETTKLKVTDLSTYGDNSILIIYINYQYLQTIEENTVKIGITHIDKNGNCPDWNHDKTRIVLNFYNFKNINNIITIEESTSNFINIENKIYYRYGYSPKNLSLSRYISKFIEDYIGITPGETSDIVPSILADGVIARGNMLIQSNLEVQNDLILTGNLSQHGNVVNFDGRIIANDDLQLYGNFKHTGEYLYSDANEFQIGSTEILINRNEIGNGVTSSRYSGLVIDRGTQPNAAIYWDETLDKWVGGIENNYVDLFTLNPATSSNLGGVIVGNGLSVTSTGLLSVTTPTQNNFTNTYKTKLDSIENNANNYIHPIKHSPSDISTNSLNRFVTDNDIIKWNNKAETTVATYIKDGLMSSTDKTKLDSLYNYTHPTGDGNRHVPATGTTNNGKVLKAGSTAGSISWGTLTSTDVGAAPLSHTHSSNDIIGKIDITNLPIGNTDSTVSLGNHTHSLATSTSHGLMSSIDKNKLDSLSNSGNGTTYIHPTGDGNLHVPATGTTNNGKVLKAGSTAGSISWSTLNISDFIIKDTANYKNYKLQVTNGIMYLIEI